MPPAQAKRGGSSSLWQAMNMRILTVVAYVGFIFTLSSWSHPPSGPEVPHIDKLAHVLEYGILGLLIAWAAAGRIEGPRLFPLLLAAGLAVAVVDEMIQRRTPGRVSSPFDIAADLLGLALAGAAIRLRRRP